MGYGSAIVIGLMAVITGGTRAIVVVVDSRAIVVVGCRCGWLTRTV